MINLASWTIDNIKTQELYDRFYPQLNAWGSYTDGMLQYSTLTYISDASTRDVMVCLSQSGTTNSCWVAGSSDGSNYSLEIAALIPPSYLSS